MRQEINRAIADSFDSIACVLKVISKELMADDGGQWANSRESIDWEIKDLIQTLERDRA